MSPCVHSACAHTYAYSLYLPQLRNYKWTSLKGNKIIFYILFIFPPFCEKPSRTVNSKSLCSISFFFFRRISFFLSFLLYFFIRADSQKSGSGINRGRRYASCAYVTKLTTKPMFRGFVQDNNVTWPHYTIDPIPNCQKNGSENPEN